MRSECPPLDLLSVLRDAEIEAADGLARPVAEIRAQVEVDHQLVCATWRYPKRQSPKVWPEGTRWHRQQLSREIVRDIQAEAASGAWRKHTYRPAAGAVPAGGRIETSEMFGVFRSLGADSVKVVAIEANRLVLERESSTERRDRRERLREEQRTSGRAFLEKMHGGRR